MANLRISPTGYHNLRKPHANENSQLHARITLRQDMQDAEIGYNHLKGRKMNSNMRANFMLHLNGDILIAHLREAREKRKQFTN